MPCPVSLSSSHSALLLFPSHTRVNAVEGVTSWLTGLAGSLTTAQWGTGSCSTTIVCTIVYNYTVKYEYIPVKSPDHSTVGDEELVHNYSMHDSILASVCNVYIYQ